MDDDLLMNTLRLETVFRPEDLEIAAGTQSLMEWALESSPVATLFIAPDETILRWNQKAAENLIPARSGNNPVSLYDLFVNRDDLDLLLFMAKQRDEPAVREALLKTPDGATLSCEVSLPPCSPKIGEPQARICFIRDLGEIKASQAAALDFQCQLQTEVEERRQAEDALQQTTVKLQEMVYEYGRRNRDTTILREMSEFLQACQNPEETYPLIARFARDLFPDTSGVPLYAPIPRRCPGIGQPLGRTGSDRQDFPPQDCWAVRRSRIHQVVERDPLTDLPPPERI